MSFSVYFQKINVKITTDQSFIVAYANLLKNWFYFWFKGVYIASAVIVPGGFVYITASHSREYRQFSNIRCNQSQNKIVSRLVLLLSFTNPLNSGAKLRMKM